MFDLSYNKTTGKISMHVSVSSDMSVPFHVSNYTGIQIPIYSVHTLNVKNSNCDNISLAIIMFKFCNYQLSSQIKILFEISF